MRENCRTESLGALYRGYWGGLALSACSFWHLPISFPYKHGQQESLHIFTLQKGYRVLPNKLTKAQAEEEIISVTSGFIAWWSYLIWVMHF
jgi:hypothetical protein